MELSPEDSLRLNVMLANRPLSIRIDESRLVVHGLGEEGETRIQLNPNCREETYIRYVRELISGHILGSPGGYPVYLKRWTRMGQMRDESLEQLLLLGEPEAVVAAVCSDGLTDELARRAWWAFEDAENARRMLANPSVVGGSMGSVLAGYLVEHLPFESEPEVMIETVRLVLQPGLISNEERNGLWRKAARKTAYYVGFLQAIPDQLPDADNTPSVLETQRDDLEALAADGNALAGAILRVSSSSGQCFLKTCEMVFRKPANQEVVTEMLDGIARFFSVVRPDGVPDRTLEHLYADAATYRSEQHEVDNVLACMKSAELEIPAEDIVNAVFVLSGLGYGAVRPVLHDSTAIGSLMRKKLEPVLTPILSEIHTLMLKKS